MVESPPTPEPTPSTDEAVCPWRRRISTALGPVTLLAVLLHPTQITLRQWAELIARPSDTLTSLAQRIPAVGITVSDALLMVAFGLWLVHIWQQKHVKQRICSYPPALIGLFVAGGLSALAFLKSADAGVDIPAVAKELVQLGIFFICGFSVLTEMLRDEAWRRRVLLVFAVAAGLAIVIGLWEYSQLTPGKPNAGIISPTEIDGSFGLRAGQTPSKEKMTIATAGNRNVLGAWASMTLPLLWGLALWARRWRVRLACGALVAGGMLLLLTGGLWVVTLAALLGISFLRGRVTFLATAAGLAVIWGLVFAYGPQQHGHVLLDSTMLCRQYDRFYSLRLYDDDATAYVAKGEGENPDRTYSMKTKEYDSRWQQKFSEWQAGLQALAHQPAFGVGLGSYQNNINFEPPPDQFNPLWCYKIRKQATVNLMEFGANSGWLVWAVTTGLIGLIAMLWLMLWGIRSAAVSALRSTDGLAVGALGAICAMAGGMFFTEYFVRGVGLVVVFAFAVAHAAENNNDKGNDVDPVDCSPL